MISRIIACSDLHIENLDGLMEKMEVFENFYKEVDKVIEEAGGSEHVRIVVAGDIFESKISVSNEAQIAAYNFFKTLGEKCITYVVAGNHDYIVTNTDRVDSITTIFEIGNPDNVIYLDSALDYCSGVYPDDNVIFHLFSTFSGFSPTNVKLMKAKEPDKTHVGIIHGDINGAVTYNNEVSDTGLDPKAFEGLDFVIAGHIHNRQEIKKNGTKIVYCSSMAQKDYGEGLTGHGFVVWNVHNSSYEAIDLPIVKGYYKFSVTNVSDIENGLEKLENL